jgi:hypothetical protein
MQTWRGLVFLVLVAQGALAMQRVLSFLKVYFLKHA